MLKSIGNRILGRILGFGILIIIAFVIIPLISTISDFISRTPSWILISSCCLGGILVFGVLYAIGNQTTQNQEKQKEIIDAIEKRNSDALKIFDSKLKENPTKTKEDYLKLKVVINSYSYELYVAVQPDFVAPEILEMNNEELELARSLFDEVPIQKIKKDLYEEGLIYHIDNRIYSLELEQETKALDAFEKRLKKDPEGTVNSFDELYKGMCIHSPRFIDDVLLSLNLSKELFGEAMLIHSSSIRNIYTKKSGDLHAIEEPIIISRALKVYKRKMAENSKQVIKSYNELLPLLDYLRNPVYYGAPERGDVCQKVFSLSEKIFDKRIEYETLFKITAQTVVSDLQKEIRSESHDTADADVTFMQSGLTQAVVADIALGVDPDTTVATLIAVGMPETKAKAYVGVLLDSFMEMPNGEREETRRNVKRRMDIIDKALSKGVNQESIMQSLMQAEGFTREQAEGIVNYCILVYKIRKS